MFQLEKPHLQHEVHDFFQQTVDLTFKSQNYTERILWAILGISGIIWIVYFIKYSIEDDNPLVGRRLNIDLSEVDYPAISICSEQTTKYAFAERLGNYLDPDKGHPDLLSKLQDKFLEKTFERYYNDGFQNAAYTYERTCKTKNNRIHKSCEVSHVTKWLKDNRI